MLSAVDGLSSAGVKPYSQGFLVDKKTRDYLFETPYLRLLRSPKFMNGHDLGQHWRGHYIIDVNDMTLADLCNSFPKAYAHIIEHVKPGRQYERNPRLRDEFWKFEANRQEMRSACKGLKRFVATLENSPQRYFVFIPTSVLPDQKLRILASDDAWALAILSSRSHLLFTLQVGGRAGVANTPVNNTNCVVNFPFLNRLLMEAELRAVGEALDAHRKRVLAEHPDLTLTGLYNVLEKIRASSRAERRVPGATDVNDGVMSASSWVASPAARKDGGRKNAAASKSESPALTPKEEDIKQRGLVLILKELHDEIDRLTAEAYGWPVDLSDEEILARLVALNAERAREEAAGLVRWLRPDYQIPRFGKQVATKAGELDLPATVVAIDAGLPAFPTDAGEATLAIEALLVAAGKAMTAAEIARGFKRGGKRIEPKIVKALTTLSRYGRISAVGDAGFLARKAA